MPAAQPSVRSHQDMATSMEIEEYKAKWEYVRHTESLQARYVEWYFGIVAAILAFIYSDRYQPLSRLVGGPPIPLVVLLLYSMLVSLRLLVQKRNYDTYTARIRHLEGAPAGGSSVRGKLLSVFKLQYYAVALVGAVLVAALLLEMAGPAKWVGVASLAYALAMISLSFTRLVGE